MDMSLTLHRSEYMGLIVWIWMNIISTWYTSEQNVCQLEERHSKVRFKLINEKLYIGLIISSFVWSLPSIKECG